MTDRLLELSRQNWFRQTIKQLGLPIPTPETLQRQDGPPATRPFEKLKITLRPSGSKLDSIIAPALANGGASVTFQENQIVPKAWLDAAEAYARPISRETGDRQSEDADVLLFDASDLKAPRQLEHLYTFFNPRIRALRTSGRIIVLGRTPETLKSPVAAATQAALEGFVRSVAKEVGRKGSTAHVVYCHGRSETQLPALIQFLISRASAFITGQPWYLKSTNQPASHGTLRPIEGRIALVTGAARGIGAATAMELSHQGARVICLDRPEDEAKAEAVAESIGGSVFLADITHERTPQRLREYVMDKYQGIDIVVHNAGVTRDKTLARMTEEQWSTAVDVNLDAVLRIDGELMNGPIRSGGRAIYLSSVAGLAGNIGQTNYAASKAGIAGYVRALAPKMAKMGVTANGIAPGFIETRLTQAIPTMTREVGRRLSALGQGGEPKDVAACIAFLASPGAAGLNGSIIRVCGGMFIGA